MPALNNYFKKTKIRNIAEYISGYVDGEGCFSISFSRRNKLLIGWETKPSFSVSQNHDRAEIIYLIQKFFECGFIRRDYSDKTLKYEVRCLDDLIEKIIPYFEKYPLLSGKQKDFILFAKVCRLMKKQKHLQKKGLLKIIRLAYKMNPSGKRRYKIDEIKNNC